MDQQFGRVHLPVFGELHNVLIEVFHGVIVDQVLDLVHASLHTSEVDRFDLVPVGALLLPAHINEIFVTSRGMGSDLPWILLTVLRRG